MKITDEFRVQAPLDRAWQIFSDIERVAPCMPGAQLDEVRGHEFHGTVRVKVGPISSQYRGVAKVIETEEEAHRLVIQAAGRDTQRQGNASALITMQLAPDGDATRVVLETDLEITGKIAQFGRGVLDDVSGKLLTQFVECLHSVVLAPENHSEDEDRASAPAIAANGSGSREAKPVDLSRVVGPALAKRLVPLAAGVIAVAAVVIWLIAR